MDKICKKYIKKIKQLDVGDCLQYYDYEIICITPKSVFMIICDMNMIEMDLDSLIDFVISKNGKF